MRRFLLLIAMLPGPSLLAGCAASRAELRTVLEETTIIREEQKEQRKLLGKLAKLLAAQRLAIEEPGKLLAEQRRLLRDQKEAIRVARQQPDAASSRPAPSWPGSAATPPDYARLIRKVAPGRYQVEPAVVSYLVFHGQEAGRTVRFVPSVRDGKPNGVMLYAIRPGSLFWTLGLENGDTVEKINGVSIDRPDLAFKLYQTVRNVKQVTLGLLRRGQSIKQHYILK